MTETNPIPPHSDAPGVAVTNSAPILKLMYSRDEAAFALGIGLRTLDRRVAEKQIVPRRDGGRVLFTYDELVRYSKRNHRSGTAR